MKEAQQLLDILAKILSSFEELCSVLELEREAIVAFNPEATLAFTQRKESIALKQAALVKAQRRALEILAEALTLPPTADLDTVLEVLETDGEAIENLFTEIKTIALKAKSQNLLNRRFVEHSLLYIDNTVQALRGGNKLKTYNNKGRLNYRRSSRSTERNS